MADGTLSYANIDKAKGGISNLQLSSPDSFECSRSRVFRCEDVFCGKEFHDKVAYGNHVERRHGGLIKTRNRIDSTTNRSAGTEEYSVAHAGENDSSSAGLPSSSGADHHVRKEPLGMSHTYTRREKDLWASHDKQRLSENSSRPQSCDDGCSRTTGINPSQTSLVEDDSMTTSMMPGEYDASCINTTKKPSESEDEQVQPDQGGDSGVREAESIHFNKEFSVRSTLKHQGSVASETYRFFSEFSDFQEALFKGSSRSLRDLGSLSSSTKAVIQFCSRKCLTLGECRDLFRLLMHLEDIREVTCSTPLRNDFDNEESFSSYLRSVRRQTVVRDNWKTSVIRSRFGENRTGVFRCVMDVMKAKVKQQGGVNCILDFELETEKGSRVYSAPWNSNAMKEYTESLPRSGKVVLCDVYSDGTCLSNSGSQSTNLMRVRFSNIQGITNEWYEVGIVPTVQQNGEAVSDSVLRKEKKILRHRFAFLAFKEIIKKSHVGMKIDGVDVFPRQGMIVADQVQERPTCGLKGHDSYYDCTHCLMPSRHEGSRSELTRSGKKRTRLESDTESTNSESSAQDVCLTKTRLVEDENRETNHISHIQLSMSSYPRRNVFETVKKQLVLARKHTLSKLRTEHDSGKLFSATRIEMKKANEYLRGVSAGDFPPVFAAMEGAGSYPYRLYSAVSFDKLHAWQHGVSRMLTDDAFKMFDTSAQYNGYTKSKIASIANRRIEDLPRSAQVKRFPAFRKHTHETHAGVTGKMRRDLLCFLWTSVMGISSCVRPDEDEFVQLLLKADLFQRKLVGINQSSKHVRRTMQDIQELAKLGFELGQETAKLLGCAVNTKLHRVMRHVLDHLVDFGCIRMGSTDSNETQHKITKRGYKATTNDLTSLHHNFWQLVLLFQLKQTMNVL